MIKYNMEVIYKKEKFSIKVNKSARAHVELTRTWFIEDSADAMG
jgi:hypothetical protein